MEEGSKETQRYKGIRDPLHFLGFDCFSYGLNKRSYMQELNAILFVLLSS